MRPGRALAAQAPLYWLQDVASEVTSASECPRWSLALLAAPVTANSSPNLFDANLIGARLVGANLGGAEMRGANLTTSDLSSANLTGAHLYSANFARTTVQSADFTGANLSFVDLTTVRGRAKYTGANLCGTKFAGEDALASAHRC